MPLDVLHLRHLVLNYSSNCHDWSKGHHYDDLSYPTGVGNHRIWKFHLKSEIVTLVLSKQRRKHVGKPPTEFTELKSLVDKSVRTSHIYLPVMPVTLLEKGAIKMIDYLVDGDANVDAEF